MVILIQPQHNFALCYNLDTFFNNCINVRYQWFLDMAVKRCRLWHSLCTFVPKFLRSFVCLGFLQGNNYLILMQFVAFEQVFGQIACDEVSKNNFTEWRYNDVLSVSAVHNYVLKVKPLVTLASFVLCLWGLFYLKGNFLSNWLWRHLIRERNQMTL